MTDQVIVLGAGRPHRGTVPAALRTDRGGVPVLDWLLDALGADPRTVVFVGGYGVEAVRERYPDLIHSFPTRRSSDHRKSVV